MTLIPWKKILKKFSLKKKQKVKKLLIRHNLELNILHLFLSGVMKSLSNQVSRWRARFLRARTNIIWRPLMIQTIKLSVSDSSLVSNSGSSVLNIMLLSNYLILLSDHLNWLSKVLMFWHIIYYSNNCFYLFLWLIPTYISRYVTNYYVFCEFKH